MRSEEIRELNAWRLILKHPSCSLANRRGKSSGLAMTGVVSLLKTIIPICHIRLTTPAVRSVATATPPSASASRGSLKIK